MVHSIQIKQANKLILLGLVLFTLGLISGLFVQNMTNPRMGLSAHLEGIMNGVFLIVLGLIWHKLLLAVFWLHLMFWLTIYGSFANILSVLIAAFTGFGKMMPIAGGKDGAGFLEITISVLLVSLSLSMLAVCALALTGFYQYMKQSSNQESA